MQATGTLAQESGAGDLKVTDAPAAIPTGAGYPGALPEPSLLGGLEGEAMGWPGPAGADAGRTGPSPPPCLLRTTDASAPNALAEAAEAIAHIAVCRTVAARATVQVAAQGPAGAGTA